MSEKETPRDESTPPEETTRTEEGSRRADQCHTRYLDWYRQSLSSEGEKAYQRWGMPLYHSMSDEEVEAQRAALGFEPKDALDHYNRACLLAARSDFAAAAKAFDRAAQLDPSLAEAVYNRALSLERAGDVARAREAWKDYLARFGDNEDAGEVKDHLGSLSA